MGRPRARWQPGDDPHTFTCDGRRFTVLFPGPDSSARTRPRPLRLRFDDSLGRRDTRWVADLDEARALARGIAAALDHERAAIDAGMSLHAAGATVTDLIEWWLADRGRSTLGRPWALSTTKTARVIGRMATALHGTLPVVAVGDREAIEFLGACTDAGLAQSTRAEYVRMWRSLFTQGAKAAGMLPLAAQPFPAMDAQRRWPTRGAPKRVTDSDYPATALVLKAATAAEEKLGPGWRLLILTGAFCGLRLGELLGLDPAAQVDPHLPRLRVDRQVIDPAQRDLAPHLTPPKNPSPHGGDRSRWTLCPPPLVDELRDWGHGPLVRADLPHGGELPWARPQTTRKRLMAVTADIWPQDHGLPRYGTHALRHHFATWALLDEGHDVTDVAGWLGHSSARVTFDTYLHSRPGVWERAATTRMPG
jgi:integrase